MVDGRLWIVDGVLSKNLNPSARAFYLFWRLTDQDKSIIFLPEVKMDNVINIQGLPPEAKASILNFYEFIKKKYENGGKSKPPGREKLLAIMEEGIYTLPDDYTFNRDELYD
jgi:hypothetical protein